jgi:hypothetical protein
MNELVLKEEEFSSKYEYESVRVRENEFMSETDKQECEKSMVNEE